MLALKSQKSANCTVLDVDRDKQGQWPEMLERLPEPKIGSKGQLLE